MKPVLAFFVVVVGLCALSHSFATQVPVALRDWVAWPVAPGIVLYLVTGGSLLFGKAPVLLGEPWVIVTVSASVWTVLFAALRWVWRLARRTAHHEDRA